MSWTQWQGETLPETQDCAEVELRLMAPDMGGPGQNWSLALYRTLGWPDGLNR